MSMSSIRTVRCAIVADISSLHELASPRFSLGVPSRRNAMTLLGRGRLLPSSSTCLCVVCRHLPNSFGLWRYARITLGENAQAMAVAIERHEGMHETHCGGLLRDAHAAL